MVQYLKEEVKHKNGTFEIYYYKIYINGKIERITKDEYNKKSNKQKLSENELQSNVSSVPESTANLLPRNVAGNHRLLELGQLQSRPRETKNASSRLNRFTNPLNYNSNNNNNNEQLEIGHLQSRPRKTKNALLRLNRFTNPLNYNSNNNNNNNNNEQL